MEEPITVQCPYCGESFVSFADPSAGSQTYYEDCQVCCKPMQLTIRLDNSGRVRSVSADRD